MRLYTVLLCGLLLVCAGVAVGGVAAAPPADQATSNASTSAAAARATTTTPQPTATDAGNGRRATESGSAFGAELAAFVSSTGAATEGTVERELSSASLNRSADPRAVEARVTTLTTRYERLRVDRLALERAYENGTISSVEYRARRAALAARAESLGDSVAAVAPVARRHGVANGSLAALQTRLPTERATPPDPAARIGPPNGSLPPLGRPNDTPATGPPNGSPGVPNVSGPPDGAPGAPGQTPGQGNDNGAGRPENPGNSGENDGVPGNGGGENPGESPGNGGGNTGGNPGENPGNGDGSGGARGNRGGNDAGNGTGGGGAERGNGRTSADVSGQGGVNEPTGAAGPFVQPLSFAHAWAVVFLG